MRPRWSRQPPPPPRHHRYQGVPGFPEARGRPDQLYRPERATIRLVSAADTELVEGGAEMLLERVRGDAQLVHDEHRRNRTKRLPPKTRRDEADRRRSRELQKRVSFGIGLGHVSVAFRRQSQPRPRSALFLSTVYRGRVRLGIFAEAPRGNLAPPIRGGRFLGDSSNRSAQRLGPCRDVPETARLLIRTIRSRETGSISRRFVL